MFEFPTLVKCMLIQTNGAWGLGLSIKPSMRFTFFILMCSLLPEDLPSESTFNSVNPLCAGRLVRCYILDESICHFRSIGSILSLLFYF